MQANRHNTRSTESPDNARVLLGMRVECNPVIVEHGRTLTLWISGFPRAEPKSVVIQVRSPDGGVCARFEISTASERRRRSVLRFRIDNSFSFGKYDVLASSLASSTVSIATFEVVPSGFQRKAKLLAKALEIQRSALEQDARQDLEGARQSLESSARILSAVGCFDIAMLAFRDLAAVHVRLGNIEETRAAIRAGLIQLLRAACRDTSLEGSRREGARTARGDVQLSDLKVPAWQFANFSLLFGCLGMDSTFLEEPPDETSPHITRQLVTALVELGESSRFFSNILESNIDNSAFAPICYLGLAKDDPSRALGFIPRMFAIQDKSTGTAPDWSLIKTVLGLSNPFHLYRKLQSLLNDLSTAERKPFLDLVRQVAPAKWIFTFNQWLVFLENDLRTPVAKMLNRPSLQPAILSSASSASFAEAQERAMAATK
jgi:hypothetical protein